MTNSEEESMPEDYGQEDPMDKLMDVARSYLLDNPDQLYDLYH